MSRVSVTQFITDDGKIQIDVTNVSGRPQLPSGDRTTFGESRQRPSVLREHDEPCSLIVSLRASHPQFFFFRGPQPKRTTSNAVASPLRDLNESGSVVSASGRRHRCSGSALWSHEVVDPSILEVSRQSWREHNFLPVAPGTCGRRSHDKTNLQRSDTSAPTSMATAGNNNNCHRTNSKPLLPLDSDAAAATATGDDRPLLVREEIADCVLLPGERRTFFIEVGNPCVLARLMEQWKQPPSKAANGQQNNRNNNDSTGWARTPPVVDLSNGSEHSDDCGYQCRLLRNHTDTFHIDSSVNAFPSQPNANGRVAAHQRRCTSGSVCSDNGTSVTPPSLDKMLPGELNSARRNNFRHNPSWDDEPTDTDGYGQLPSRQPLSIVGDSSTTRASASTTHNLFQHSQQQQQRASGMPDSLRSSRDYVVPPTSSSFNSDNTFNTDTCSGNANKHDSSNHGSSGCIPLPRSASGDRYVPPSLSQRPVFYVYYSPLGDENKCVDRARKWLAREQRSYHEWRENLVKIIVGHERKREHMWTVTEDHMVVPPQPRLEVIRILPPVLGELVRWRSDDGSSLSDGNPIKLSPVTIAAFHYYFTRGGTVGDESGACRTHSSSSNAGLVRSISTPPSRHYIVPEAPVSFAATRVNRVSKKAKKMFAGNSQGDRQGAGTVVIPLRVPNVNEPRSGASPATRRNWTKDAETTSTKVPSPGVASLRPPLWHRQQEQQRDASQMSCASESPVKSTTPTQVPLSVYDPGQLPRLGADDEETNYYAGSLSPNNSSTWGSDTRRPRFRTGRGLALLDDSVTGPPSPSVCAGSEPAQSAGEYPNDVKQCFSAASTSCNSRWSRTETLDPEAAELAARNPTPSRDATTLHSPRDAQPALQCFPSTLESSRPATGSGEGTGGAVTSPDVVAKSFFSVERQLHKSSSSCHLNAEVSDDLPPTDDGTGAGAATAAAAAANTQQAETESNNTGSFVAHLIQSFCGLRCTKPENTSNLGGEAPSPHVRNISSAPPQRVTYHRYSGPGSPSFNCSGLNSTNTSLLSSRTQQLGRLVDRSIFTKGQMRDLVQQLAELVGTAAVQLATLLQEHGPSAVDGVMTVLNFLKDSVFTPENVRKMEMVITPMVVVFSATMLLYLLFGGGGADEALPVLYSGNL